MKPLPRPWLLAATLACASLTGTASALQGAAVGTALIPGHAADTFDTLNSPSGFAGGLAWGPDGTAYTLDGARVLYRWNAQTGQPLSRRVLTPPASLPDAKADFGPRLRLDSFRPQGALRGPYIRVSGYQGGQPYTTAFTLTADGRSVIGSLGYGGAQAGGRDRTWTRLAQVESVTTDGRARLVLYDSSDAQESRPTFRFTLPAGRVLDMEPSPDGTRVAALRSVEKRDYDPNAVLYLDVVTREGRVTSRRVTGVGIGRTDEPQVRWVNAEQLLTATPVHTPASSAEGHRVSLWGLTGQRARWELGTGNLRDAVPSPDGQVFLTVRDGSVPEVRRVSDGVFLRSLGTAVTASAPLSRSRALLALDTGNGQGELGTVAPGGRWQRVGGQGLAGVAALAVSPDERRIATVRLGQVGVLDRSGRTLHILTLPENAYRVEVQFADARTLVARFEDGSDGWRLMSWDTVTGQVRRDALDAWPVGRLLLRAETRRLPNGVYQSRLGATDPKGQPVWQDAWRAGVRVTFLPSPDGRAVVRGLPRPVQGVASRSDMALQRLDPRTGQAGPELTLRVGDLRDVYRGLRLLDYAADRRFVLLGEGTGDGCGGAFYGLRLADLETRREVKLPAGLTSGLTRFFGCGQPVPIPTAAFTPEGKELLVRDGNALSWWTRP